MLVFPASVIWESEPDLKMGRHLHISVKEKESGSLEESVMKQADWILPGYQNKAGALRTQKTAFSEADTVSEP